MIFSLRRKMIGAFVLISMLVAATCGLSYYYLKQMDRSYASLLQDSFPVVQLASGIQTATERQSSLLFNYVIEPTRDKEQQLLAVNAELAASIDKLLQQMGTEDGQSEVQTMKESNETFARLLAKVIDYVNRKEDGLAKSEALLWSVPLSEKLKQTAGTVGDREKAAMDSLVEVNNRLAAKTTGTFIAFSAASLLIALAIGVLLSRAVVRPMRTMVNSAGRIADCDLTVATIELRNRDEIGELAAAFNRMKGNLHAIVMQVGSSTEQVASAAEALSANTNQLSISLEQVTSQIQEISAGTEEQARQVQDGVSMMEETSRAVESIIEAALTAKDSSKNALQASDTGQAAISQAMLQMNSIERTMKELALAIARLGERSSKVVQAVDVITGVARQTNMLALNASIEAARAGAAGKGFAVVAEEVRKLSLQTSTAAEQVTELISGICVETDEVVQSMEIGSKEVGIGLDVVRQAGGAFAHIRSAADEVAAAVGHMYEQSSSIASISQSAVGTIRAVHQIAGRSAESAQEVSTHTEQQYASMEEMVSSAAMLSSMAEELRLLLAKFRV